MAKKIRRDPINIAPDIVGKLDDSGMPLVRDIRTGESLDPYNPHHKVKIYERQVNDWFLLRAENLIKTEGYGFIVLMICISYLEGVEQYRQGIPSNNNSRNFFRSAIERIYPQKYTAHELNSLYDEARCGLFHDGMVRSLIIISYNYKEALAFKHSDTIKINPKKLLKDIQKDFEQFIQILKTDKDALAKFNLMYSNL